MPAAPAESVERELKVRLDPGVALPAIEVPGVTVVAGGVVALSAIYHDTTDARLARSGATLRRRTGGPDEGWHLKLESQAATGDDDDDAPRRVFDRRLELHLPLAAGAVGSPPAQLLDIVAALTRGESVLPLARVQTRRRLWHLLAQGAGEEVGESATVAVLCDDAVVTTGIGPDGSLHQGEVFREVEVELVPGPGGRAHPATAAVARALRLLLDGVGATPSPRSKGAEALGDRAAGEADVVVVALDAEPSAADLLRTAIARQVRALVLADVAVRRGAAEGIHDFRVAARRLRSLLGTFQPVLAADWARGLRRELRWAAGAFGAARDTEVQVEILTADAERLRDVERALVSRTDALRDATLAVEAIAGVLEPRFASARGEALDHLRSARYRQLLDLLVAAAREPRVAAGAADERAREVLAPLAARAEADLRTACAGLVVGGDPTAWHRARILAKRARYAAEVLALPGDAHAESLAGDLAEVTTILGAIHDAHVSRVTLREIALGAGATRAGSGAGRRAGRRASYLLGVLDGGVAARERELQTRFLATTPAS